MSEIKNIYCLAPVFNDWESFSILVENIIKIQKEYSKSYLFSIVAINDFSTGEHNKKQFAAFEIDYTTL